MTVAFNGTDRQPRSTLCPSHQISLGKPILKGSIMFARTLCGVLTVLGIVGGAATTTQATIIMDATTNNGSFSGASNGNWTNAASVPAGWNGSPLNPAYTQSGGIQPYYSAEVWNNTGVVVAADTIYP